MYLKASIGIKNRLFWENEDEAMGHKMSVYRPHAVYSSSVQEISVKMGSSCTTRIQTKI